MNGRLKIDARQIHGPVIDMNGKFKRCDDQPIQWKQADQAPEAEDEIRNDL
jgi:hypothetical protein